MQFALGLKQLSFFIPSHSQLQKACFSNVTPPIFTKQKASQGYTSHAYQFMEPDIANFDLICDAKQPLGLEFTNEQGAALITQWCHRIQSPA